MEDSFYIELLEKNKKVKSPEEILELYVTLFKGKPVGSESGVLTVETPTCLEGGEVSERGSVSHEVLSPIEPSFRPPIEEPPQEIMEERIWTKEDAQESETIPEKTGVGEVAKEEAGEETVIEEEFREKIEEPTTDPYSIPDVSLTPSESYVESQQVDSSVDIQTSEEPEEDKVLSYFDIQEHVETEKVATEPEMVIQQEVIEKPLEPQFETQEASVIPETSAEEEEAEEPDEVQSEASTQPSQPKKKKKKRRHR